MFIYSVNARRLLALVPLTVLASLAVPAGASAYSFTEVRLWDRKTVTYKVADPVLADDMKNVVSALRRQAGIRLVRPRSGQRAGITITRYPRGSCRSGGGQAVEAGVTAYSVSIGPGGREAQATVRVGKDCTGLERYLILAHEVGHALGLGHENDRCALMNTVLNGLYPFRCSEPLKYDWRAKPYRSDDVAGFKRRFRGLPR